MRTTRFVMLAPLRVPRRSLDRRSTAQPGSLIVVAPVAIRPAMAKVIASRWSERLSVAAPASGVGPLIAMSSPSTATRAPRASQAGGDPGDPVRLLGPQLAGAPDRGRAPGLGRGQAQDRDLVDRLGDLGRRDVDRAAARSSGRRGRRGARPLSAPASRDAVRGVDRGRSSIGAPIRRRRSMTARRVGIHADVRQGSARRPGWIAPATSQNAAADGSAGTISPIACTRTPPSRLTAIPPPSSRLAGHRDAPRPEHPLGVVAGRHRLAHRRPTLCPQRRKQDRRLHLGARHPRPVVIGRERAMADHGHRQEGIAPARMNLGAHLAQWLDDTGEGSAAQ